MSASTGERVVVEVRCPAGPRKLLLKLKNDPNSHPITHGNLMELKCDDCTRRTRHEMSRAGLSTNFRIIHCFAFDGTFIESLREPLD